MSTAAAVQPAATITATRLNLPAVPTATKDPYEGVPRHVWQSLFGLISMIRPDWQIDGIAYEIFRFRRALPFPELSAAAIRAAQDSDIKTTFDLRLAVLDAADQWLEAADQ